MSICIYIYIYIYISGYEKSSGYWVTGLDTISTQKIPVNQVNPLSWHPLIPFLIIFYIKKCTNNNGLARRNIKNLATNISNFIIFSTYFDILVSCQIYSDYFILLDFINLYIHVIYIVVSDDFHHQKCSTDIQVLNAYIILYIV